jgi:hypothetical protein
VLRDDLNPTLMMQNLAAANEFNLKEGVVPAVSLLKMANASGTTKCMALLVLQKFGGKEHLPLVEPLLTDPTVCFDSGGLNQQKQVQLRDMALVTTILLSGQDPKKFGFERFQNPTLNFNPIAFANEEERKEAFLKWKQREAGQSAPKDAKAPSILDDKRTQ